MKKTILYTALFLAVGCATISCKKAVDLNPTHTIDGDDLFKTLDDYELALTGAYARLQANSLYSGVNGGSVFLCGVDLAADNFAQGPNNLGNLNTLNRWNYTASSAVVAGAWNAAYNVVQRANITLRGIDRFRAAEPLRVNRIEGQARALRAFMHFELLRWWASEYDRNSTAKGVPYTESFDIEKMPARGTVKESYDKIEADLKTARNMLASTDRPVQSNGTAGTDRAYIDAMVCDAMLARMYVYSNQPDSAIKYATRVINVRPLADADEFPLIWEDASTREVVWSIKYQSGDAALAREIYDAAGDKTSWAPVAALLNLYAASDIRGDVYFGNGASGVVLTKYLAKTTAAANPDGVTDFKILRTAEMYLIRAEAYYRKTGMDVQALADLNTLRTARGAATGAETGTNLFNAIQTERRKELVVEGHRFFDIKRTTHVISRTGCTNFCTLATNNRAWAFPIPQQEILANTNMTQTDGY